MKRLNKRYLLTAALAFLLLVGALTLRLTNLTKIPVFADEAIYIRWSQVMRAESTLRFLPLSDGKQPLYMWVVIPFLKVFSDPLVAGRLVSVLSGMSTMVGVGVLSFVLFKSKKASIVASFLYALSPFTFFFDRLALADSMLAMFVIWFMVFLALTVKQLRLDFAMIAGFALGGALLTKSPGLFSLLLIPSSIFLIKIVEGRKQKIIQLAQVAALWSVIAVIGYGLSQILRLGPNYHMIAARNLDYVFPLSHILENAKDPFIFHLDRAFEWIFVLGPVWILLLAAIGVLGQLRRQAGNTLFLLTFFAFPLMANAEFARVFTARYIFFILPPLFVLAGTAILHTRVWQRAVILIILLFTIHSVWIDKTLLVSPELAPLPQSERSGYLEEWSAGWGIAETAKYISDFQTSNPNQKIVVGTEGYFGTLPDGLQIYLEKKPNIVVIGTGLNFKKIPDQLIEAKKSGSKVFFVVNSSRLNSREFSPTGLTLIYSFVKPDRTPNTHEYVQFGPRETFYFFEVN